MTFRKLITNLKTAEERLDQKPAARVIVSEPAQAPASGVFPPNVMAVLKLAKGQTPAQALPSPKAEG